MKIIGEVEILSIIRDQSIVLECEDISGFLEKGCWLEFQLNGKKVFYEVIGLENVNTVSGAKKGPIVILKVDLVNEIIELKKHINAPFNATVKKLI
ncbi:MAG: hypothetical protein ACPGLV_12550 [Bacteroidia bacterium]